MAEPILMPRLTIDMEKGTLLEWTKDEGETVEKGETVAVVFGDKVEWEVEAPASGVLLKILVAQDEEAGVARPIGYVGEAGETVPVEDATEALPASPASKPGAPPAPKPPPGSAPAKKPKASPAAKRIAREKGIELSRIEGSGPGGRIVEADVLAFDEDDAGPAPARHVTLTPLRKTIAERMLRSWRTVPHFTVETEVDMGASKAFRKRREDAGGTSPTLNDLIVASVGRALAEFEALRVRWEGETLTALGGSNLGVAVHTEAGLVVPVLENAGAKTLSRIASEIREMAGRAREGKLTPGDLRPASMTVTNLGMFGITRFTPVVNHPECSILSVGKVEDRVVALEGLIGVRPRMALDLALDHRAIDGGTASQFLARVKEILEAGEWEV